MKKAIRKTTTGYPLSSPKGAKPMEDPQLDMRTWKEPVEPKPKPPVNIPRPLRPGAKRYFA